MDNVMKRLKEIESRARQNQTYFSDSHYFSEEPQEIPEDVAYLLNLTRALLESQGELLPLAQDAEGYYNNRMGDCACYRSCKHCEAWDKKQRAAREVIARAEKVRKGEV